MVIKPNIMTREEYIKICNTCENRGFDPSRGVICGLSSELPAFEANCEDYKVNEEEKVRQERVPELDAMAAEDNEAARNDVLWGAVWCMGGIIATAADIGYIFWGAIVFGGYQLIKGISNGGASSGSNS